MCLGPLTNIALAVNMCPNFVKNVKDIYIMGGNFRGVYSFQLSLMFEDNISNILLSNFYVVS